MGRPFEAPRALPLDEQSGETFPYLVRLMQRLLAPDGCPWDREQTQASVAGYLLEEACEVIDAVEEGDAQGVEEELGDVAMLVAFMAELGRRQREFGPDDVVRGIVTKLVSRHPHVFGDAAVANSDEVLVNWERLKEQEKGRRPLLAGIPRSLPALMRAQRMSRKVAKVGFDWPDTRGSRAKVDEELQELDDAIASGEQHRIQAELGDVLFALVNLGRRHNVDAEAALRGTADRFSNRFAHVESRVGEEHGDWPRDEAGKPTRGLSLDELDGYWNEAKRAER